MCGRYTLTNVAPGLIGSLFGVDGVPDVVPRFNISPTQEALVVRVVEPGAPRTSDLLRWGLVPSWSKDIAIGDRMINARGETAADKPAFRVSFRRQRCLVVTDGFYEWKKLPTGKKQPCWIHRPDGAPFAFAGLWARWKGNGPDAVPLDTFTILTTDASPTVSQVHDRMPVIIPPDAYGPWLDPAEKRLDLLQSMISPAASGDLVLTPVSTRVNNPRNEGPENVRPLELA
jgi:putative SOS response-associated peptidase YedK